MKGIEKARMGMIAMLALMLVSIKGRLPEERRVSSGTTMLALAGIVLLVAAGSASAEFACVADDCLGDAYFFGDTVMKSCTLNGSMSGSGSGLFIGADGITIDGNNFGITGSNAAWSYGILNYGASQFRGYHNVVIKNLDISGFQEGVCIQGTSTGPYAAKVENNTIYNCTVRDNGANTAELNSGCGIHFYCNIWNSTIDNCRVYNTTAMLESSCDSPGAGIRLYSKSCYNNVTNCEIYRNALAGIYSKAGSKYNRIDNNDVHENAAPGAHISFPGGIRMQCKNTNWWTVSNNEVWDNYGPGIFVGGQNCILYKNEVTGSKNCTAVGDGSRGDGIIIDRSDTAVGGTYNKLTSNTVCDNEGYDIYMQSGKIGNHGDENTCDKPSNWNDDGTTGCTYPCSPLEKPDLVITDKYETLDPVTGQFTVTYTVENQDSAGAGVSTTSITDGTITLTNSVGTLAAGESHTGTAGPFNCPCGTDVTVTVCADNDNVVDESNETNNCLNNTFDCPPCLKPDLEIVNKSETLDGSAFTVTYRVENNGGGNAGASTTCIYVDGTQVATDPVGELAAGESHTGTAGPFNCPCGTDVTVTVCADNDNVVDESNETNNCLNNTFDCPPCLKPDLEIVNKSETLDGSAFTVTYRVENNGGGNAGASTTCIYVDGTQVATDPVGELAAGESHTGTAGPFNCPCGTDVTVTVCADNDNVVDESNETNNCLNNTFDCPPCLKPDLEIINKSEDWVDQLNKTYNITYTVANNGDAAAGASTTSIKIDGVEAATDAVPALSPCESHTATFGPFTMSGDDDMINVCADRDNVVDESDETNNCLENTFTVEGEQSYGGSVYSKKRVKFARNTLGEPDDLGAVLYRNAKIAIELEETVPACKNVSVWVTQLGFYPVYFEVAVSADGSNWNTIGSETCNTMWVWTQYDFDGEFGDMRYIKITKPGSRWPPKFMGLDAVYAKN